MNKNLIRYPVYYKDNNLFAWSSADELLLEEVFKTEGIETKNILIINDQFGALSSNLKHLNIETYTDSYLSSKSIEINSNNSVELICDLDKLKNKYELVLVYLPKSLTFFEDILCKLSNILDNNTPIIFTGMIKHISHGHFQLIEKYIGDLTTSLSVKKARLIYSNFNKKSIMSPYPKQVNIIGFDFEFTNHSNVFSRNKLDIGTRFFLENLPSNMSGNVLDLGCGNGIIGIKTKILNSNSKLYFNDESYMAIKSASINYKKFNFSDDAQFLWTHCTEKLEDTKFDLILCNPPFHQGTTISKDIAIDMFKSSFKILNKGGMLRIVANSHLGYQQNLKRIFGNYKLINSNKKFVILESVKNLQ